LNTFSDYEQYYEDKNAWAKVIWDLAPVAFLIEHQWVPTNLTHSPHLSNDLRYGRDMNRHLMHVGTDVQRDYIFDDFFETLGDR
jgi:hypothetical protein